MSKKKEQKVFRERIVAVFDMDTKTEVEVTFEDKSGMSSSKKISISSFISALGGSVTTGNEISLNSLPRGFYKGAISSVCTNTMKMFMVVPAGVRQMIHGPQIHMVPFPDLLFYFEVLSGKLIQSSVYAMETGFPDEQTPLFRYPFGNVHMDGNICWGNIMLPHIENPKELEKVLSLFFSSETNNDLYVSSNFSKKNQDVVLKMLEKKQVFPTKNLRRLEGKTVGEVLKETGNID